MAQKTTPAPIGTRLARLREARGLSAQQLADRLEGSGITRSMITNLETGRKRDLTSTEVLQIASGLEVSIWALIVDTSNPWGALDIPGLYNLPSNLTIADAVANRWGDVFGSDVGDIPRAVKELGEYTNQTFLALKRYTRRALDLDAGAGNSDDSIHEFNELYVPDGSLADSPHLESARFQYRNAFEAAVHMLSARTWLEQNEDERLAAIPADVWRFAEQLRDVVTLLARFYEDEAAVATLEGIDAMRIPDLFYQTSRMIDLLEEVDRGETP